jgi:hypothetical protein
MSLHPANNTRTTKLVESEAEIASLQLHLKEILEAQSFRGSQRSAQFLRYIVEQALAGRLDSLKERLIGVELFGRLPSYDTGNDAIVRVTASDVRKRLQQYYHRCASGSSIRIVLPLGTYVPELYYESHDHELLASDPISDRASAQFTSTDPSSTIQTAVETINTSSLESHMGTLSESATVPSTRRSRCNLTKIAIALIVLLVLLTGGYGWHRFHSGDTPVNPLAAFFNSPHTIYLITSDPDIAEMQQLTGTEVSVSDYANHRVFSSTIEMTPEMRYFRDSFMRTDKAAAVDAQIAVHIGELAQSHANRIMVRTARSIQMSDLQSDNNFILLGSPRSNPWSSLFSDQLDFQFSYDKNIGQEIIRNIHPRLKEASSYIPTAMSGATGKTYAIIALVRNFNQTAQILLIAGADAEGTEAAGKIVTNGAKLAAALQHCNPSSQGTLQRFQLLVGLNTMAGIPRNESIEACHTLPLSSTAP